MDIKRYKLKEGISLAQLKLAGAKPGGTFVDKTSVLFISKKLLANVSLEVAFPADLRAWNDQDFVLVLDNDYGQPYSPFYTKIDLPILEESSNNKITFLSAIIQKYNEIMDSLDYLEEIV